MIDELTDTLQQFVGKANNRKTKKDIITLLTKHIAHKKKIYIKCDQENNTKSVVNDQKLIVDVYIYELDSDEGRKNLL